MSVDENGSLYEDIYCYFPENFFHKSVNEPFIQYIMGLVLNQTNWIPGNPDLFEPDYFCDGVPFEFTLASDKKRKNNFIQKFRRGTYSTVDLDEDIFGYIQTALESKASKTYSSYRPHLCILCTINQTNWVLDKYGSETYWLIDWGRSEYFESVKHNFIDSGIFQNVFIIFPDMYAKWWVWDVSTNYRADIKLAPEQILSGKFPYALEKNIYDELMCLEKKSELTDHDKWIISF